MNHLSGTSVDQFQKYLFRHSRRHFAIRWEAFADELLLSEDPKLSEFWADVKLRHAFLSVEAIKGNVDREVDDYKVAHLITESFEYRGLEACKTLIKAINIMMGYLREAPNPMIDMEDLTKIKEDTEAIMIFAKCADECNKASDRLDTELKVHLDKKAVSSH